MPHYATLYLGLHCLPKYPFRSLHSSKGTTPHLLQKARPGLIINISATYSQIQKFVSEGSNFVNFFCFS